MPKKPEVTEIETVVTTTEPVTTVDPVPVVETVAAPTDPVLETAAAAAAEAPAPSPEATQTTETTPFTTNDLPAGPRLIPCVALHGRLTHEGKTYAPHERVSLPVDLALGLIDSGHVARAE